MELSFLGGTQEVILKSNVMWQMRVVGDGDVSWCRLGEDGLASISGSRCDFVGSRIEVCVSDNLGSKRREANIILYLNDGSGFDDGRVLIRVQQEHRLYKGPIDLGLSVKWASWNVDASAPEGYGGYYAWGETKEKNVYDNDSYIYYRDTGGYGGDAWQNIGSNICGTSYDVAHVKWGSGWRMPTESEITELLKNCTRQETTVNGVNGQKFTGPNGNSIFLPAAGYRNGTDVYNRGSEGYYWSGMSYSDYGSYCLRIGGSIEGGNSKVHGYPIRPVKD